VVLIEELYVRGGLQVYDRDGSGTVEVMELVDGLKQGKSGIQWQGMVKEIETLVSQFGAKGGLLTFDDFVKVFQEVL
jgi:Ca2+-binding EF-hand superfamily protein